MAFQKFGHGQVLKPEQDEREQMQRTASQIEHQPPHDGAGERHEEHDEE